MQSINQMEGDLNFTKLKDMQTSLRQSVAQIIHAYPHPGIYRNELSIEQWRIFTEEYKRVLINQGGERGELVKEIHQLLVAQQPVLKQLFSDLGIAISELSHIKHLAIYFESFTPCQLYVKWRKISSGYQAALDSYQFISCSQAKRDEIMQGLLTKHPKERAEELLINILEGSQKKVIEFKQKMDQMFLELQSCPKYNKYLQLMQILQPEIDRWNKIDQQAGKDNITRGSGFEVICETLGLDLVIDRMGLDNSQTLRLKNVLWNQIPGEIDFVLMDSQTNILAFVECKSRLFDIAEGYRQSGPEGRLQAGKTHILHNGQVLFAPPDTPCFVITTIPPHSYHLGFESELKLQLAKVTISFTLEEIQKFDFDELFHNLVPKFSAYHSPTKWLEEYGNDYLFVFPSNN